MKKTMLLSIYALSLSFSFAQETCESLLTGLEKTLEQTQSIVREVKIKAGFIQLASVRSLAKQTADGLEITLLEQTGRQLANDTETPEPSFLGQLNLSTDQCENHKLKAKTENSYELELIDRDEATPQLGYTLNFKVDRETYLLEGLNARVKPPESPLAINMETTFTDWTLE